MPRVVIDTLIHAILWPVWFTLIVVVVTLMIKWAMFVSGFVIGLVS